MTTTGTPSDDRFYDFWLPDYCPRCNPVGHLADRCLRSATLTDPEAITWHGGKRLICEYRCACCCHVWSRTDLWTAEEAGFDPKRRKAA